MWQTVRTRFTHSDVDSDRGLASDVQGMYEAHATHAYRRHRTDRYLTRTSPPSRLRENAGCVRGTRFSPLSA